MIAVNNITTHLATEAAKGNSTLINYYLFQCFSCTGLPHTHNTQQTLQACSSIAVTHKQIIKGDLIKQRSKY